MPCLAGLNVPVIPARRRLGQEDDEFKSSLGCILCLHLQKGREVAVFIWNIIFYYF